MSTKKFNREKIKKLSIKRLFESLSYSFAGLKYACFHERWCFVGVIIILIVSYFGLFFELSVLEWLFIILAIGLILGAELINTSIEAFVDLVSPEINPLAKIAKDTASASVFIFSLTAVIGGSIIFLPKILEYFNF